MDSLHEQISLIVADRTTQDARALFEKLASYIQRRVDAVAHCGASDLLGAADREDIIADVLYQLVTSALAQFRGETLGELFAYVRVITDRSLWRRARRVLRERKTLDEHRTEFEAWTRASDRPDDLVMLVPDLPLSADDEAYLRALLEAGSKAELARKNNLSRAAVTQRVQRIRHRIGQLGDHDQLAVEAWLHQAARDALSR
jgi:hypothetical protein